MHTLLILIPSTVDLLHFDEGWPSFLHQAEQMPGLLREEVFQVDHSLTGQDPFVRLYSFHFPDQQTLITAMTSPPGKEASRIIHRISRGKAIILTGDHKEDQPSPSQQPS